jgi:hypothetical protein
LTLTHSLTHSLNMITFNLIHFEICWWEEERKKTHTHSIHIYYVYWCIFVCLIVKFSVIVGGVALVTAALILLIVIWMRRRKQLSDFLQLKSHSQQSQRKSSVASQFNSTNQSSIMTSSNFSFELIQTTSTYPSFVILVSLWVCELFFDIKLNYFVHFGYLFVCC